MPASCDFAVLYVLYHGSRTSYNRNPQSAIERKIEKTKAIKCLIGSLIWFQVFQHFFLVFPIPASLFVPFSLLVALRCSFLLCLLQTRCRRLAWHLPFYFISSKNSRERERDGERERERKQKNAHTKLLLRRSCSSVSRTFYTFRTQIPPKKMKNRRNRISSTRLDVDSGCGILDVSVGEQNVRCSSVAIPFFFSFVELRVVVPSFRESNRK